MNILEKIILSYKEIWSVPPVQTASIMVLPIIILFIMLFIFLLIKKIPGKSFFLSMLGLIITILFFSFQSAREYVSNRDNLEKLNQDFKNHVIILSAENCTLADSIFFRFKSNKDLEIGLTPSDFIISLDITKTDYFAKFYGFEKLEKFLQTSEIMSSVNALRDMTVKLNIERASAIDQIIIANINRNFVEYNRVILEDALTIKKNLRSIFPEIVACSENNLEKIAEEFSKNTPSLLW